MQSPLEVVTAWGAIASRVASDATSLSKLVALLPAPAGYEFGRFDGGSALSSFVNAPKAIVDPNTTIVSLEARAAAARATVASAIAAAKAAAAELAASTALNFAAAIQEVSATVLAAFIDPADAIRLLPSLADFSPVPLPSGAPLGQRQAAIVTAIGNLCRRAAISALAQASSIYQPSSQDDAQRVSELVCSMIDIEALIAANNGLDATFFAFNALRAAVSADLGARGANLAAIVTVSVPAAIPSLVLANRLYRDSTRELELVAEGSPVHPAFMPTSFKALAA